MKGVPGVRTIARRRFFSGSVHQETGTWGSGALLTAYCGRRAARARVTLQCRASIGKRNNMRGSADGGTCGGADHLNVERRH